MAKSLFSITCTTCQARLKVFDASAIGAILACPKCESMVLIQAPPGWKPPAAPAPEAAATPAGGSGLPPEPSPHAPVSPAGAAKAAPPPLPMGPPEDLLPADVPELALNTPSGWLSRRLMLGWVSVGALVVLAGVWAVVGHRHPPPEASSEAVEEPADPVAADEPQLPQPTPEVLPGPADPRWVPHGTKLLLNLHVSRLAAVPESDRLLERLDSLWQPTVGGLMQGLGLKTATIRRLSWACTDLGAWPDWSVVVVELEPNQDAGTLAGTSQPTDLLLGGTKCYRRPGSPWPHPFAVIDAHTIVTGRAELLAELSDRGSATLASKPMERLRKALGPDPVAALRLDVGAARAVNWRLPEQWMDVWPPGRRAWHTAWELADGIGCTLEPAERIRTNLFFTCEAATAAEKVRMALDEWLAEARKAVVGHIEALPARLQAGRVPPSTIDQYDLLLKLCQAALGAARTEIAGPTVCVRASWGDALPVVSQAALASQDVVHSHWLSAARTVDEANQEQMLKGLGGYQTAQGYFPAGAVGGALLPPETRLSWIATLLPYYGHTDWHRQLEFGYPWNGPQNAPIARRPLEAVINPALGPDITGAGFPVTQYVGVAGVGPDAGLLKADDPRAGLFGYGRTTRLEEITDGAANTIAILGVTGQPGAWAAGGAATARPLTKAPYVNGPDGFGSGQPDGMLAGLADGSVRFIAKDVDPRVLEQLATIHGGEHVSVAMLDRRPVAPEPPLRPLVVKPEPEPEPEPKPALPVPAQPKSPPARPTSPEINVEARLGTKVVEMDLSDSPLEQFVRLASELCGVAITLDPEALARLGVSLGDPISVKLAGGSVRQVLEAGVSSRGLAVVVANNQVLVTSPRGDRETLHTLRYSVSDLTRHEPAAAKALAALVCELVAPESWRTAGGPGTAEPEGDALRVEQTEVVHYQVIGFCERLRQARKLPLLSRYEPERFPLATRLDRAAAALARPVVINFRPLTPLARILPALEDAGAMKLLVDWPALAGVGMSPDTPASMAVDRKPLSAALDALLQPLGLAYRAVGGDVLQITTRKAVADRLELEFYPAADLVARFAGPALIERIKAGVAKATWSDAGGPAAVELDEPSGYLLVLQSPPAQADVAGLLRDLRAEKK